MTWPEQGQWTFDDWLRLPDDGFRYELIQGELLMSPPPSVEHQNAVSSLLMAMRYHARKNKLGLVLTAPISVRLAEWDVVVQPDVLFVSASKRAIVKKNFIEGAPDLVVEVLSSSNWMIDRGRKQELYQPAGVTEYWVVDYRTHFIDVFVLESDEYIQRGHYSESDVARSEVLTGFSVSVEEVFAL
jgi:Uma2 family endonuclease